MGLFNHFQIPLERFHLLGHPGHLFRREAVDGLMFVRFDEEIGRRCGEEGLRVSTSF